MEKDTRTAIIEYQTGIWCRKKLYNSLFLLFWTIVAAWIRVIVQLYKLVDGRLCASSLTKTLTTSILTMSVPNNANSNLDIVIQPGDGIYLELWMIGVILSAFVYGGVVFLSLSYLPFLLKTSNDTSPRKRNFLLVYVTCMVAISTIYTITISVALTRNIFRVGEFADHGGTTVYLFQNGFVGAWCVIFASWGADGFMLWRCAVLHEGISRGRRITLLVVLIFLALASFGSGLTFSGQDPSHLSSSYWESRASQSFSTSSPPS